jgi:hypothetical protein
MNAGRGESDVIVHLFEYRVVPGHEEEVAGFLRNRPQRTSPPDGLMASFAASRLSQAGRVHLVVTTWRDTTSCARGTDSSGLPAYLAPKASLLTDRSHSRYRVVSAPGLGGIGAPGLRLYRTTIAARVVADWEKRTIESTGQLASRDGLKVVLAGIEIDSTEAPPPRGEVRVVVMTAWTEWNLLLAATGGRLKAALQDTELAELERPAVADHFEILVSDPGIG